MSERHPMPRHGNIHSTPAQVSARPVQPASLVVTRGVVTSGGVTATGGTPGPAAVTR
jgi:hypothetical protein